MEEGGLQPITNMEQGGGGKLPKRLSQSGVAFHLQADFGHHFSYYDKYLFRTFDTFHMLTLK
jgi:hypothetical protein